MRKRYTIEEIEKELLRRSRLERARMDKSVLRRQSIANTSPKLVKMVR